MVRQRTREETLRAALRQAALGYEAAATEAPAPDAAERYRTRRYWLAPVWRAEAAEFVRAIVDTATLLRGAPDAGGQLIFRSDTRYRLLATLERIGGWPSVAEIGRALRISKQAARQQVIAAGRRDLVELLPDPYDRRSLQVGLTPGGKDELAAACSREFVLVATLLNGLEPRDMRLVAHVLRVIRERLLAIERDDSSRVNAPSRGR